MKRHNIIIGIAGIVLLAAAFMYFSFGGVSRGIQKVISNDGLAELTIPRNALPEGMSIKDISITNVSVGDTMIAYELKPDGASFLAGLTFKTTFKNKDNIIPVPFLISKENGIEPVNGAETTLDLTKNETTISMLMAHFSVLAIPLSPANIFFKATMEVPAQVYIEEIVTAKATLHKVADSVVLINSASNPWVVTRYDAENRFIRTGYRLVRDSVKIKGKVINLGRVLAPDRDFDNRPPLTPFTGETLTVASSDYRCNKLGNGLIHFWFDLTYEGEAVNVTSDAFAENTRVESSLGVKKIGGGTVFVHKDLECVARPSVLDNTGSGVSESESKAVGDILDEAPAAKPPGKGIVCGLPGGPACPPKK